MIIDSCICLFTVILSSNQKYICYKSYWSWWSCFIKNSKFMHRKQISNYFLWKTKYLVFWNLLYWFDYLDAVIFWLYCVWRLAWSKAPAHLYYHKLSTHSSAQHSRTQRLFCLYYLQIFASIFELPKFLMLEGQTHWHISVITAGHKSFTRILGLWPTTCGACLLFLCSFFFLFVCCYCLFVCLFVNCVSCFIAGVV